MVLRATVMSPYILPMLHLGGTDLMYEFMKELHVEVQEILGSPGNA